MSGKLKLALVLFVFLYCIPCILSAYSHGLTLGTWGGTPDGGYMEPGTHGYFGGTFGLTRRIEAEVFSVVQTTPEPFSRFYGGAACTFSLVAPRELPFDEPVFYLNMHISLGYIQQISTSFSPAVFARFTPLVLAGPDYTLRERGGSFGIIYDFKQENFSVFWNFFLVDFY